MSASLETGQRSHDWGHVDYLEDDVASAFFAAREAEAYYRSLKSVDEKRAFHDRLTEALTRLLSVAEGSGLQFVDELLARAQAAETFATDRAPRLRGIAATGLRLLGVDLSVDVDTLRTAYRNAALRHHPDRGGSNEDMAAVNEAYEQLHAFAVNRLTGDEAGVGLGYSTTPATGMDYCWSVTRLLFEVALDDWALEDAQMRREQLASGSPSTSVRGRVAYQRVDLLEPSVKLAERLTAAHRIDEAKRALTFAQDALPCIRETGLNYDYFAKVVEDGKSVVSGATKPRFVINHIRQLENARRLGAVDRKRYESTLARLGKRASENAAAREAEERALASASFLQALPTDPVRSEVSKAAGLVPQPGYFQVRVEDLSIEQQGEYMQAFASNSSLELVQKYAWVRLSSLFRSAVYHIAAVDPAALEAEIRLLSALQPKCAPHAADVLRVVSVLDALAPSDRVAYAAELQRLLEPETTRFSTPLGDVVMTMPTPAPELSARFLDSAMEAARVFDRRG